MDRPEEGGSSDDSLLRELVLEVLEGLDRVGPRALDAACREHPDLANRLRARIAALAELGLAGASGPGRLPERIGDFRLLEVVGSGGMGVVYRAEQISLAREVALKLVRPDVLHRFNARERFARETTIIARLQHPGIVPIYVVGEDDELPFYAMELVSGCTLAEALLELQGEPVDRLVGADLWRAVRARTSRSADGERDADGVEPGPLFAGTWEETCLRVIDQVAEALQHAHARGIVHRDLKPSNVMVTPGGRVMLLDFGLSASEGSDTMTGTAERIGSLPYMPPELLSDGPRALDVRGDVYALGVVLYEMLTLQQPFRGELVPAVMASILEGRPPRPRAHNPGLSWECETVCLAAIERNPARRYQSVEDLSQDLSNVLHKRPVHARRASLARRARRWVQRRPAEAAVLALLVSLPTVVALLIARESRNVSAALTVAEDNRDRAVQAIEAMLVRLGNEELEHVPRMRSLRHAFIADASALYEELLAERPDDLQLALLASRCELLRSELCDDEERSVEAREFARRGLELLEPWSDARDFELRLTRARLLAAEHQAAAGMERHDDAGRLLDEAVQTLTALQREAPDDMRVRRDRLKLLSERAFNQRMLGGTEEGLATLRASVDEMRDVIARGADDATRSSFAVLLNRLGVWLGEDGRLDEAVDVYGEELALRREIVATDPQDEVERHMVAFTAGNLAGIRIHQSKYDEALALLDEGLDEIAVVRRDYPEIADYACSAADLHLNRGVTLGSLRRFPEARAELQLATGILRPLCDAHPDNAHFERTLGTALVNLATREVDLDDPERALATCDEARLHLESALRARTDSAEWRMWVGIEADVRARILLALGRPTEAAESLIRTAEYAAERPWVLHNGLVRLGRCLDRVVQGDDEDEIQACEFAAREVLRIVQSGGRMEGDDAYRTLRARIGGGS